MKFIENNIKKELEKLYLHYEDIILEKIEDDIYYFKVYIQDECYVLKYYDYDNCGDITYLYKKVENAGILPIHFIVENKMVIYKDFLCDNKYRCLRVEDLSNEILLKNLCLWMKKEDELLCVDCKDSCYFCRDDIEKIMEKFSLKNNETFAYIYNNFDNICLKIKRNLSPVIINHFSLESLVVCEENKEVFNVSFECFGIGDKYERIKKIFEIVDEGEKGFAFASYYQISEEEKLVSNIYECLRELCSKEKVCDEVKTYLNKVYDGTLLGECRRLVECY